MQINLALSNAWIFSPLVGDFFVIYPVHVTVEPRFKLFLKASTRAIEFGVGFNCFELKTIQRFGSFLLIVIVAPGYLARTLIDTPVWSAIETAWRSGSSLAGCSAGAMAMGKHVPNFFRPKEDGTDGFGIIGEIRTIPHYNKFFGWIPDAAARKLLTAPAGTSVIGIDESTALITGLSSDPDVSFENKNWRVHGEGHVHLLRGEGEHAHKFAHGEIVTL